MDVVTDLMRMIERLVIVGGGIVAIYLGYRLFLIANLPSESGAKLKVKAIEITVTKIGPGIFFAALGSYILWTAMTQPVVHEKYTRGFLSSKDSLKAMPEFKYQPPESPQSNAPTDNARPPHQP
jgi:hypothetical protein